MCAEIGTNIQDNIAFSEYPPIGLDGHAVVHREEIYGQIDPFTEVEMPGNAISANHGFMVKAKHPASRHQNSKRGPRQPHFGLCGQHGRPQCGFPVILRSREYSRILASSTYGNSCESKGVRTSVGTMM